MKKHYLDKKLHQYRRQELSWNEFVYHAVQFIDTKARQRHRMKRDERCDIISGFYPRLVYLVDNYRDEGSSFDAYLAASLFHYCRKYVKKKLYRRRFERPLLPSYEETEDTVLPELVAEPAPVPIHGTYDDVYRKMQGPGHIDTLRRQLLFVFCKNIPLLKRDDLQRFAEILNIPGAWVFSVYEYATHRHADRLEKRATMRACRNTHFSRMISAERDLKEARHPAIRAFHTKQYMYHRRLWIEYVHRLKVQYVHLSHRDLSILLGISKGSIDSAIYVFFQRVAIAAQNS